ncbi:MAG: permease [Actinomycetota bacterium]
MAVIEAAPSRTGGWRTVGAVGAALAAAAVGLRLLDAAGVAALRNFLIVFASLLVEALPFIVLGAAVSALIEVFVPASVFARLARLPRALQQPVAGLGGFAFPVCECGSVPVARRLVSKGMSPAAAITFMLAAPILNPVVLVATAVAYRGRDILLPMVLGRAGLGLLVAIVAGWVIGSGRGREILRADRRKEPHDHGEVPEKRWSEYFGHLASDFTMLARYLVIGAAIAAALQTFLPQQVLASVAGTPVLNILALMVLATLLSLCSESDAFVAASFVQFGMSSQLAFLVAGPMIDAKLAVLYGGTFRRGFVLTITAVVYAVTLAGALWFQVVFG